MSLSATLFGRDSAIFKATNILGLGIPGWLDRKFGAKPLQGASLGEMASQTSKEGVARPIIWGIVRPIGGNIIATSEPIIRQIESETDSGGKGGGSKSKKTMVNAVYRTYAIRICEGPITGIRRVWRNTKLVYDGRGNAWGATNNGVFLTKATFYLGGWDQLPSPALQSIFGVAAVTAHRGTCYMTMSDEDLTDLGGAIPQFIFEVERAEGMPLTSRIYPIEDIQAVQENGTVGLRGAPFINRVEGVDSGESLVTGSMRSMLQTYRNYAPEGTQLIAETLIRAELRSILKAYPNYAPEAVNDSGVLVSGTLTRTLIRYANYAPEAIVTGESIQRGSLG
ncbi:hypothetical protein QN400_10455 [Pseudomonas sp. RTC3]|uniref:hypothetical protein n=1 Tax=unclassified Pseudomonas TaxID=196821 RepID=UPI002AB52C92|nr:MULTISPECIES: hypothetical protein [unclassified Pseudomonas]MEB0062447.1 hypothetical protein [Pseudomonas sp. RTC3]MDY7565778.1 hypothetical protein [Pseudomonas sp. 5C2]MEB0027605.1 hypothetical protein [Pseudomonas sp. MH9.2]MEB0240452.1 hypothetical protein [Pseudomonas sp. 5C2]WPX70338.1 hypothetical protein RHM55_07140 [Pseudomonas sp. MH9.2]